MDLLAEAARQGMAPDAAALVAALPYCRFLGVRVQGTKGRRVLELPFDAKLIGNPVLPALHGGVIGSFLEVTAIVETIVALSCQSVPKTVDITTDYLRSGRPVTSFAAATVVRQGRRVANVQATMWQDDEAKPIATLRGHFLLSE